MQPDSVARGGKGPVAGVFDVLPAVCVNTDDRAFRENPTMGLFSFRSKSEPKSEPRPPDIGITLMPAWHSASLLVDFLESRREQRWSRAFASVQQAIASGDAASAIRAFDALPMAGMGGLADFFLCQANGHRTSSPDLDNRILSALISNLTANLDQLRAR